MLKGELYINIFEYHVIFALESAYTVKGNGQNTNNHTIEHIH